MKLEILVSTMKKQFSLVKKMHINSNSIIINQDLDSPAFIEEKVMDGNKITLYTLPEKGVGLSRNTALSRAKGDICIMADDDVVYTSEYENIISDEFRKRPNADMIIFNVRIHDKSGISEKVKKEGRVRFYNYQKYGTVTFAFKRKKIIKNNIFFSLMFGGGATYGSGEDTLFLKNVLKCGLKVYTCRKVISDVYNFESTWFQGYNDKYFYDKGALFKALNNKLYFLNIIQFVVRKRNSFLEGKRILNIIKIMMRGAKDYKNNSI